MRTFYVVAFLLIGLITQAQIVDIPDANFKNALVNHSPVIDTNGDGEIQVSEAETATILSIADQNIQSLLGIEYFINLEFIICFGNEITDLDLSNNNALITLDSRYNPMQSLILPQNGILQYLYCYGFLGYDLDLSNSPSLLLVKAEFSGLESINTTNSIMLEELDVQFSNLTELDLSNCTNLVYLDCYDNSLSDIVLPQNETLLAVYLDYNELTTFTPINSNLELIHVSNNPSLTTVDISQCTSLAQLFVRDNNLRNLNISNGNNTGLIDFNARDNPELTCIQVDDVNYANNNPIWFKDPIASYSEFCLLGISDNKKSNLVLYPNPVSDLLTLSSPNNEILAVHIYNLEGKQISHSLDLDIKLNLIFCCH